MIWAGSWAPEVGSGGREPVGLSAGTPSVHRGTTQTARLGMGVRRRHLRRVSLESETLVEIKALHPRPALGQDDPQQVSLMFITEKAGMTKSREKSTKKFTHTHHPAS